MNEEELKKAIDIVAGIEVHSEAEAIAKEELMSYVEQLHQENEIMNKNYEIKKEDYEQYWQKGGTYVMPIEVFNDLFYDIEQLKQKNNVLTEFEHWLEERIKMETWDEWKDGLCECLDKLQELKRR